MGARGSVCMIWTIWTCGCVMHVYGLVQKPFDEIQNFPRDQFAIFYHSKKPNEYKESMAVVEAVERKVSDLGWAFHKCDGDMPINQASFVEAEFNSGTFLFTATTIQGIERYFGPVTVEALEEHIRFFGAAKREKDVIEFKDEDDIFQVLDRLDPPPLPVFVEFYEKWCTHCQRLGKFWNQAASKFRQQAVFGKLECSANEGNKAFCKRLGVSSYPAFFLWTGETRVEFEDTFISVLTIRAFFSKHIPNDSSPSYSSSSSSSSFSSSPVPVPKEEPSPAAAVGQAKPDITEVMALRAEVEALKKQVKSLSATVDTHQKFMVEYLMDQ
eukprot:gb/GEZN01006788.1/.p1 GENE.gb/GEZN01006788.1/~~gb/GEZN01006788.1/.p1  ORF type:complete len:327 (-),score=69.54 gb/GEZN01006788.1/:596-1576(-)